MLQFAFAHPARYTHVLKTDDDTWVQSAVVMRFINNKRLKYLQSRSLYAGCFVPFRRNYFRQLPNTSKWFMSEGVLPEGALPKNLRYANGYGYILSSDLIEHVILESRGYLENNNSMPVWYHDLMTSPFEDVMIGLLVRDVALETSKCEMFQESCEDLIQEASTSDLFQATYKNLAVRHLQDGSPHELPNYVVRHEQEIEGKSRSRNIDVVWRPLCRIN